LKGRRFPLLAAMIAAVAAAATAAPRFRLPPLPPPEEFGNVLISRSTATGPVKPAAFSHWTHRLRYTCRVCHLELDFAFKRNETEITEAANRKGLYCGACHDGKTAFGHTEPNCGRCHTGSIASVSPAALKSLPPAKFGNGVDWSAALAKKLIAPRPALAAGFEPLALETTLKLEAEWDFVPPAVFPHADHVQWLDCANCHPSIFNIKKKTTKHFSMQYNLAGDFCGTCHMRVAFPLDDCKRCHPTMRATG